MHVTHLLNLLDMMCKYEMDLARIVGVDMILSTDVHRWTDGRMDRCTKWNQYTPLQLRWGGYNYDLLPITPIRSQSKYKNLFQESASWNAVSKITSILSGGH